MINIDLELANYRAPNACCCCCWRWWRRRLLSSVLILELAPTQIMISQEHAIGAGLHPASLRLDQRLMGRGRAATSGYVLAGSRARPAMNQWSVSNVGGMRRPESISRLIG